MCSLIIWKTLRNTQALLTAREAGLGGMFGLVVGASGKASCMPCAVGAAICKPGSLQPAKVWAWLAAGINQTSSGQHLSEACHRNAGSETRTPDRRGLGVDAPRLFGIAAIVFFASIVIPGSKFMAIALSGLGIGGHNAFSTHRRHQMYELVEFVAAGHDRRLCRSAIP